MALKPLLLESLPGPISQTLPSTGGETSAEESLPGERSPESDRDMAHNTLLLDFLQNEPGPIDQSLPTPTSPGQTSAAESLPRNFLPEDSLSENTSPGKDPENNVTSESDLPAEIPLSNSSSVAPSTVETYPTEISLSNSSSAAPSTVEMYPAKAPPANSSTVAPSTLETSADKDLHPSIQKPVVSPLVATEFTYTHRPPLDKNTSYTHRSSLNPNAPAFTSQMLPQIKCSMRQLPGIYDIDLIFRDPTVTDQLLRFLYLWFDETDENLVKGYVW